MGPEYKSDYLPCLYRIQNPCYSLNNGIHWFLGVLCAIVFVVVAAHPALAQDAVKVDPRHYKVEVENAQMRVLRITDGPHEKSVMHGHPASVAVFLTDGQVKFTLPNGKTDERSWKAGQTMWVDAGKHLPENVGDKPLELILVELKAKPTKTTAIKTKCGVDSGGHQGQGRVQGSNDEGLGALPQLPALAMQAGGISVVLVEVKLPGGDGGLCGVSLTGRRIVHKHRRRFRGVCPGCAGRQQERHEQRQEPTPAHSTCGLCHAPHTCVLCGTPDRVSTWRPSCA